MRQLCHPRGAAVGEKFPTVGGEREDLGVERLVAEAARRLHLRLTKEFAEINKRIRRVERLVAEAMCRLHL